MMIILVRIIFDPAIIINHKILLSRVYLTSFLDIVTYLDDEYAIFQKKIVSMVSGKCGIL
jgi:hypothetical protein